MSRVDDDRQAARLAERIAQEKRLAEDRTAKKQEGESAFSKLLQKGGQEKAQLQKGQQNQLRDGQARAGDVKDADANLLAQTAESQKDQATTRGNHQRADLRKGAAAFGEKLQQARAGEGERASESRLADGGREQVAVGGRTQDQQTTGARAEGRRDDARRTDEAHEERGTSLRGGSSASGGARGAGSGGKADGLRSDADGGGGKGAGGDGKGGGKEGGAGSELAAGFRFNPALMAPVPVAQPKENRGSEKLRALANEIAQKIVQSARVGTNAAGQAEFQIDLRSNVLAGLSIKVSGGNGKIRAVFSGNDREVLKLIRNESESLKAALGGRGLKLEEFRIEERA